MRCPDTNDKKFVAYSISLDEGAKARHRTGVETRVGSPIRKSALPVRILCSHFFKEYGFKASSSKWKAKFLSSPFSPYAP